MSRGMKESEDGKGLLVVVIWVLYVVSMNDSILSMVAFSFPLVFRTTELIRFALMPKKRLILHATTYIEKVDLF